MRGGESSIFMDVLEKAKHFFKSLDLFDLSSSQWDWQIVEAQPGKAVVFRHRNGARGRLCYWGTYEDCMLYVINQGPVNLGRINMLPYPKLDSIM